MGAVAALGPVEPGENIGSCSRSLCSCLSPPFCSVGIPLLLTHLNLDNLTLLHCNASDSAWLELACTLLCGCHLRRRGERAVSSEQADASELDFTGSTYWVTRLGQQTDRGALIGQFEGGRFKLLTAGNVPKLNIQEQNLFYMTS